MAAVFVTSCVGLLVSPTPTLPVANAVTSTMMRANVRTMHLSSLDAASGNIFPPTTSLLAKVSRTPSGEVSLSDMMDDVSAPGSDAPAQAARLRAQLADEEALKAARAKVAIERMEKVVEEKQRLVEANEASGVPVCQESVWGSGNTGLLSSAACRRDRDGQVEGGQRTGFFLVF